MVKIRLQKYLAQSGVASRRKAEELIKSGKVHVNGEKVITMGLKVSKDDIVEVDGERIHQTRKNIYIMLNKPGGYVTTVKDQFSRKTVIDLVPDLEERVYPVGRLDYETTGLLFLTNDGDFTFKLTHPGYEIKKVYIAKVKGSVNNSIVGIFKRGIRIDDYKTSPAGLRIVSVDDSFSTLEITIHEGRNRQIRKMCEACGHPVVALKRIKIGNIDLGNLPEGQWRYLRKHEITSLMKQEKSAVREMS